MEKREAATTPQQKLVVLISILASFVSFFDGSVVSVALPAIAHDLSGGLALQQWVVDSYLVTLGALMLTAGSFSDIFGRKKILMAGLWGFAAASLLCAVAPSGWFLIVARGLQGVAGAFLVPSSLALIVSAFSGREQGRAIGTWTAWTGIAFIIGPLLGGFLTDVFSWRLIFAINLLPIGVTMWLMRRLTLVKDTKKRTHVDIKGAVLCILGLGGPVFAGIEQGHYGWSSPLIYVPLVVGIAALGYFLWHEHRIPHPMLPPVLFRARNFSVGNMATLAIYAGLSVATFLVTIFMQQVGGYTAVAAGLALLPVTILMFVLSPRFGALAGRMGPRFFMGVGPIIAAAGFLYMGLADQPLQYWTQLFPGVVIFGFGLSMTVAPLTAAILGSVGPQQAGIGSAVNNAVARIAGLAAIAAVGLITGPMLSVQGFRRGTVFMALLLLIGGLVSIVGIQNLEDKQS